MLAADTTAPAPVAVAVLPAAQAPTTASVVLGTVAVLGVLFGISAIHGQWAYGDWTCAFKSCVAVAPVRRRRKS